MNDSPEPVDLSPSRAELIARVRARGRQIRAHRRLGIASIAALVVIGIAAPAIAIGTRSSSTSPVPPAVPTTAPTSTVAPRPDLVVSIELPSSTIVAGSELDGTLVIENTTGKSINLAAGSTCRSGWAVTLESSTFLNQPTFPTICVSGPLFVDPGTTHWPFTILGSYYHCADPARPANAEPTCPAGSTSGTPPLPVGDYKAVLVTTASGFLPPAEPVPVRVIPAAASTGLGPLAMQFGARNTKMLVPAGWTLAIEDGGGSGSGSTWTNPADANEQISGVTGVELGSWWETDGVKGSITPQLAAPGTQVQRVNYTTFLFHSDPPNGYPIDGVWIALVTKDGPNAYVSASVQLPSALHSTATTIINRFISDTNARVPPFPGPPRP